MTRIQRSLGASRRCVLIALAALALLLAACDPSTPATPTPFGASGVGETALGLAAHR